MLTVTADSGQTKVYGQPDPPLTYQASGFLGGDTAESVLTGALSRTAGENVGSYAINQGSLSAGGNYTIVFISADFAITPLPITGNFTAGNKVYDGNTSATVLTRTLNGVLTADLANVRLSGGTATFADPYVGPSKTVTLAGAILAGSAAANYTLSSVATTVASITSKALTVSSGPERQQQGV